MRRNRLAAPDLFIDELAASFDVMGHTPRPNSCRAPIIRGRRFPNPRFDQHAEMAQRSALWRYRELAAPHHAAVTMPGKVADLLLDLAT